MRVLGIDPGLAICGYGVLEQKNKSRSQPCELIEVGVIKTPAEESLPKRLHTIYTEVKGLIREFNPDALAVEELFFNKNTKTAMAVSQARGVVLLAGAVSETAATTKQTQKELIIKSYTPLQIKQRITGYGRAKKPQIQAMMKRLLNLKEVPKPDDAADALAVALCYILEQRSKTVHK